MSLTKIQLFGVGKDVCLCMQPTRLLKNKVTMKTGKTIFWTGFIITIGIIIAYLLTMIIGVAAFAGWIVSLSLCGIVMVGAVLMIIGRAIEKRSGGDF